MQYASKRLNTKPPKTPQQRFSNKRRIITAVSGVVVVLALVVAYTIYSVYSWYTAEKAASSARVDVKAAIDQKLGSAAAPVNSEVALTTITKEHSASMVGDHCDLPILVRWQEVLWFMKDATTRCQGENKDAREVLSKLDALRVYVVQSNMIAKKLTDTAKSANGKKLNFADAQKIWESAATNIETQSVDSSVMAARTSAVEVAKGIIAAYASVQAAEKSQNRAKYDAAIVALGKSYDAASKVTELTKVEYSALLEEFLAAYEKL